MIQLYPLFLTFVSSPFHSSCVPFTLKYNIYFSRRVNPPSYLSSGLFHLHDMTNVEVDGTCYLGVLLRFGILSEPLFELSSILDSANKLQHLVNKYDWKRKRNYNAPLGSVQGNNLKNR